MEENTESAIYYIKKSFELKNLKLYKEAIEMLYKALSCEDLPFGKHNEIIAQIGDLYMLLKNYERAIEQYEKVLDNDPAHIHSMHQLCEIYFILQNYSKALEIAQNLCKKSQNVENYVNYFRILFKLHLFDEIKELYKGLNEETAKNDEIMYVVSKTEPENKFELLEKIIRINPNNLQAKLDLGILCYEKEDFEYAKTLFDETAAAQNNPKAYYYLGLIYNSQNEHTRAIDNFLKAIKYDKSKVNNYYFELAKAYCDINWLNEAQIALLRSLSILSDATPYADTVDEHYFLLAWIYSKKNDTKNAILNLNLIEPNSHIWGRAQVLANTLKAKEGDIIEAKGNLEKLYETNKDNSMIYSALGEIYKELKLYKKAIEIYKEGLKNFPSSFSFLAEIVGIFIDDKNYDEALKYADDFIKIYPNCPSAHNSLARIYYRQKEYKKALDELLKLVKLDKNNAEAFYFMGLILNDTANPEDALKNLTVALNLNPTKAKYYAQVSRSYNLMENYQDAMLFIKEAIELAPEELSYKKQAAMLAEDAGDKEASKFYKNLVQTSENITKMRRKN